jgi:hypothetical protein
MSKPLPTSDERTTIRFHQRPAAGFTCVEEN